MDVDQEKAKVRTEHIEGGLDAVWIILGILVFITLLAFLLGLCRAAGMDGDREREDEIQLQAIREWQRQKELRRARRSHRSKRR